MTGTKSPNIPPSGPRFFKKAHTMYKHSITGAGSLQRAIEWTRWLKSNGYEHKRDWDWVYNPSQQDGYKKIDFYFRDESLLTLILLKKGN